MNTKFKKLSILNAAAFLIMVVVNALSVILPLNGMDPGQISDSYPNLFAPAGLTLFDMECHLYMAPHFYPLSAWCIR